MTFSLYITYSRFALTFANLELLEVHTIRRAETIQRKVYFDFKYSVTSIMGSYNRNFAVCHFNNSLYTYRHLHIVEMGTMRHYFGIIPVYLRTLSHFEIFFGDTWKAGKRPKN